MEGTCFRCKRVVKLSNLVSGMICLECQGKSFELARKMVKFMDYLGFLYRFSVVISGLIGAIFIILNPASYLALLVLMGITIFFIVVSLFGMLPHMFPAFSESYLEEIIIRYNDQFSKYNPEKVEYCIYHPHREADGRCANCFEPFCTEHLIWIFGKPSTCQNCGQKVTANLNFWAVTNGLFSVGILSGVGIFLETVNVGSFGISFVFVFCILIVVCVIIVLIYYYRKMSSQLQGTTQSYEIR